MWEGEDSKGTLSLSDRIVTNPSISAQEIISNNVNAFSPPKSFLKIIINMDWIIEIDTHQFVRFVEIHQCGSVNPLASCSAHKLVSATWDLLLQRLSSQGRSLGFPSLPPPAAVHSDEEVGWGFLMHSQE